MKQKKVFVYGDDGASRVGVVSLLKKCNEVFGISTEEIFAEDIIKKDILDSCALLIFPGGAGNFYRDKLNGIGNDKIKDYIKSGGNYLGICAGAYYACDSLDFHGEEYDVIEQWELSLFKGTAKGSLPELTNGRYYDESSLEKAFVTLKFEEKFEENFEENSEGNFERKKELFQKNNQNKLYYYHGGPTFIPYSENDKSYDIVAKFENEKTAIIKGSFGKGKYFLSSVHFELQKKCYKNIILKDVLKEDIERENALFNSFYNGYGDDIWSIINDFFEI